MRFAKDTYLLAKRCLTLSVRNPAFLFMGIITPFLYLSLFVPLLETLGQSHSAFSGNVLNTFVPGMLPYIAFTTGLFTGFGTIDELRSGLIERFRVTPVSRFAILMGYVIRDLCETLFQCLLFTLTALAFGF
ncbi:MAG: ABC transporter permease, partial [Chlamydiae bacterium]|nr:ABC transporter permease [Chlamydiota bacterium]